MGEGERNTTKRKRKKRQHHPQEEEGEDQATLQETKRENKKRRPTYNKRRHTNLHHCISWNWIDLFWLCFIFVCFFVPWCVSCFFVLCRNVFLVICLSWSVSFFLWCFWDRFLQTDFFESVLFMNVLGTEEKRGDPKRVNIWTFDFLVVHHKFKYSNVLPSPHPSLTPKTHLIVLLKFRKLKFFFGSTGGPKTFEHLIFWLFRHQFKYSYRAAYFAAQDTHSKKKSRTWKRRKTWNNWFQEAKSRNKIKKATSRNQKHE